MPNFNFRLLASTADSGEDFLGNKYRSVVTRNVVDSISTLATDQVNSYWLSKPNPSKFAVECLYFDVSGLEGRSTVIDRILLDPITPGVYFNVYYSDDGEAGTTEEEWEQKLWQPIGQIFKAERRQEHALPEPITAKYVCLEFTHLQAQYYSPGTFHEPTPYKKHPKWVLDYFLARLEQEQTTTDPYVSRRVNVVYDALDIGFNYYLDDLGQDPTDPESLTQTSAFAAFMNNRDDVSDRVSPETLDSIKLALKPYTSAPGNFANGLDYILGMYAENAVESTYSVEKIQPLKADTTQVSTLNRDSLVIEQNYPVMFFFLRCRHGYRQVQANFESDRGYFAGIRELAFTRDQYATISDNQMYVETLIDSANVIRNDFIPEGPPRSLGRTNTGLLQGVFLSSIAPATAFGTPTLTPGVSVRQVNGVSSGEAFGTFAILPDQVISVSSVFNTSTVSEVTIYNHHLIAEPWPVEPSETFGEITVVME